MNQERWLDLQRWLSHLPRQAIDEHPDLVLAEAWLLHHRAARTDLPERWRAPRRSAAPAHAARPWAEHARLDEETRQTLHGEIDTLISQSVYWTADAGARSL